ncbi:MAG: nicotinate (nicotinamide) nucleotide adenylyltransferase [Hyphomonadaceae bacterium]|nr:nicotinate (nicotinamide) nucleotide adenylyltransferase [Hyphomonadaceae bacterium]
MTCPRTDQAVGLFGGSFNPAHAGHLHVAKTALKALDLDEIWWMVSRQHPLKPEQPDYETRVATVLNLPLAPRMRISHMEPDFGTSYTRDTLRRARIRWPHARFVFVMGADNFLQLPKWRGWHEIMHTVPVLVISRPDRGSRAIRARLGKAAVIYRQARIPEWQAHTLKDLTAPAWTFLTKPLNPLCSSAIRAAGNSGQF